MERLTRSITLKIDLVIDDQFWIVKKHTIRQTHTQNVLGLERPKKEIEYFSKTFTVTWHVTLRRLI